jgi:transposase-like protein
MKNRFYMKLFLLLLMVISCNQNGANKDISTVNDSNADSTLSVVCAWSAYGDDIETFHINLNNKKAYWANEEKDIEVLTLNDALIKLKGIKKSVLVNENEYKKNIEFIFTINRISGEFKVETPEWTGIVDLVRNCQKGKLL